MQEVFEKNGYIKAIDDAIEKFLEYGCFCIEWNPKLPKEKLVEDVLRQVKGQSVYILEKLKQKEIEIVNQVAEEYGKDINVPGDDGWIPCSERLPEDGDCRFYMCIVENHEDDVPMFCQFEEEYGFGYWQDIYDEYSLGFLDSEFLTNEELGYEKVIAWQPLPAPYQPKGE